METSGALLELLGPPAGCRFTREPGARLRPASSALPGRLLGRSRALSPRALAPEPYLIRLVFVAPRVTGTGVLTVDSPRAR
jgi:hypothetical protein